VANPYLPRAVKEQRGTVHPVRERSRPKKKTVRRSNRLSEPRDFVAIADRYVADILTGAIVACRWTRLACARFERMRAQVETTIRIEHSSSDGSGHSENGVGAHTVSSTWSPAHVVDVCTFIEQLPHVEGRWESPTIVLEPWQIFLLAAIYGFRRLDGGRLVNVVFFEVARKSAKSTLVAALGLYHLLHEGEPGAQVVAGATTGAQARIVFGIAQRMVRRSLWLREAGLTAYANAITSIDGSFKPINAKSSTQDGLNPSFISLDESHAQDFGLHDVLKSAQGSRRDPLLIAPTTAGHSLTSVGYALRATTMKLLEGVLEADHLFGCLYEADAGDDWRDEATWIKACPMLGVSPTVEFVRRYRDDALATPGLQAEFEVKITNRWLHAATTWLNVAAWQRCAEPNLSLESFEHEQAWIGIDLAERSDIAVVALCFKRDGLIFVFVRGYLPALVVSERVRVVPEYRLWVERGDLIVTPGNLTDYSMIEADLRADCDRFDVQDLAIERFGALNLAANLTSSGLPARVESKNAKVFTAPAKELEARIGAQQIRHAGTSFLTWQISNCCVERRRDGSLLPTKDAPNSANKIDGVDAILLALSGMLVSATTPAVEPGCWFLEA
jgi:phage terminase large subunit-like protein